MTCSPPPPPATGIVRGNSAHQHNSYQAQTPRPNVFRLSAVATLLPNSPAVQLPAAATVGVCLQHAKPQSQHVQHFLLPFAVPLYSRILLPFFRREQTNNCEIDMTDLSLIIPTHSLCISISLSLSFCVPLQIWPLGNAPRRCHYNCSHLAAGRLRLVCAHLAGHSST